MCGPPLFGLVHFPLLPCERPLSGSASTPCSGPQPLLNPSLTAALENSPAATCLNPPPMSSLPTRSVWGVVVPLVLLSPVIAFFLPVQLVGFVVGWGCETRWGL